jgi:hypothetical protein
MTLPRGYRIPTISNPSVPPITTSSIIRLVWGLTLNLSADQNQQIVGKSFLDQYMKLSTDSVNIREHKKFFDELNGPISSFLRNMGYEKDFLVQELDIGEKIRQKRIENIAELADMTSLSAEGLIARVIAFIFGGTITSLSGILQSISRFSPDPANTTTVSSEMVTKLLDVTWTNQTIVETVNPGSNQFSMEILAFLLGGTIGFFAFAFSIKLLKGRLQQRIINSTIDGQQAHWKKHVRPEYVNLLYAFFCDLKKIINDNFPGHSDDWLVADETEIKRRLKEIIPKEQLYIH